MIEPGYCVGLIGARGGSKAIPRKNLIGIGGFPLIAYSIIAGLLAKSVDRVIVSTDDEEIADIARIYGAEVPFMRPEEFSRDESLDIDFVLHTLNWISSHEDVVPEYIVHLRPTAPLRTVEDVEKVVTLIKAHSEATSLRSAHSSAECVFKDFRINEDGFFEGLFPIDSSLEFCRHPESYNLPRQNFPETYHSNGYIDVIVSRVVLEEGSLHGKRMLPFFTEPTDDIDTPEHRLEVERKLKEGNWEIYEYLKTHFNLPRFPIL